MRLVCVANNPFPYHTPILNELAARTDLHVVYMAERHPLGSFDNDWGVTPEFGYSVFWSRPVRWKAADFRTQISWGVSRRLSALAPDVVLFSSWGPLVWEPLLWKQRARRAAVMWAESTTGSGLLRGRISNRLRRTIVGMTDAFVSNGTQATAYLHALGAAESAIVTSCLPSPASGTAPETLADAAGHGPHYLFVGRLIPLKCADLLIDVFPPLLERFPAATLTIVGDGPERPRLERDAKRQVPSVRFLGRIEGAALAEQYARADVLVIPSRREVWGLVVNEALAHGLYVVATEDVASAHDLLGPGLGSIVRAGDADALLEGLIRAAQARHDDDARRDRAASVAHRTPARFAEDIVRACELAVERVSGVVAGG